LKPKAADVEKLKTMAPVSDIAEPFTSAVTVVDDSDEEEDDDVPVPVPVPVQAPTPVPTPVQAPMPVQEESEAPEEPKKKRILKKK
jgi:hypothetical protein